MASQQWKVSTKLEIKMPKVEGKTDTPKMKAAVNKETDSPEVNIIKTGFFHSFIEALLKLLGRAPFFEAAFLDVP